MQSFFEWLKGLFAPKAVPQPTHDVGPIEVPPSPEAEAKATGYRLTVLTRWRKAVLTKTALHAAQAKIAVGLKASFYDPVEKATGVPWYVVAAIHMREMSFSKTGYLGNGDPWNKVSVHVPRNRGPFTSWYEGAIDALHLDGLDKIKHWDIVTALIQLEEYNGIGYKKRGVPSPYVWAGTSIQVPGKFVADGKYSSTTIDTQPSCAGLFLALKLNHGVDLNEA